MNFDTTLFPPSQSSVHLKTKLCLEGRLKATARYVDREELIFEEDNLIVLGGRQLALAPLFLAGRISDPIATLRIGSGGTLDSEGKFPKTPTSDKTTLYNQTLSVGTSYTYNSSRPSVTFLADVPESSSNGSLISEAGLFTASGLMFNLKTFGGIPKTSDFSIHFEWTISVV
jgi:hypothetical protein